MTKLTPRTKIIIDESIINKIFAADPRTDLILDYVKFNRRMLCTTVTLYNKLLDELKRDGKPTKSYFYVQEVLTIEDFDMKEEALTSQESIIDYVNTVNRINDVFFITEKSYPMGRDGNNSSRIKDSIEIFNLDLFCNFIKADRDFMAYIQNAKNG